MIEEPDDKFFQDGRTVGGNVVGLLRLTSRPGTPQGGVREYRIFSDINIILYLSSWNITGSIATPSGQNRSFSIRLRDESNILQISIGTLRWQTSWPGNEVDVFNDIANNKLTILFDQPFFSSNDSAWYLDTASEIHVQGN